MRITPLDIRKQEFRRVVRGLDGEEVMAFLATVADEYEAILRDNKQLRERILDLDEKITEYRTMERTLRDTLMTAERVMQESKENARKEGDLILKDAEMRAHRSVEAHHRQAADLRRQILQLHKEKEAYLARFKGLAEAQIQFIENHRTDFEELDRRLMEAAGTPEKRREAAPVGAAAPAAEAEPAVAAAETAPAHPATPEREPERGGDAPRAGREADEWRDYEPGAWGRRRHAEAERAAVGQDVDRLLEPLERAAQAEAQPVPAAASVPPAAGPAASEPPPASPAAPAAESQPRSSWDMDAFTRGLDDR